MVLYRLTKTLQVLLYCSTVNICFFNSSRTAQMHLNVSLNIDKCSFFIHLEKSPNTMITPIAISTNLYNHKFAYRDEPGRLRLLCIYIPVDFSTIVIRITVLYRLQITKYDNVVRDYKLRQNGQCLVQIKSVYVQTIRLAHRFSHNLFSVTSPKIWKEKKKSVTSPTPPHL